MEYRERDWIIKMERLQKERDMDDERRERAKDKRAQAIMMNTFMMANGRSLSAEDSPSKKFKEEWRKVQQ